MNLLYIKPRVAANKKTTPIFAIQRQKTNDPLRQQKGGLNVLCKMCVKMKNMCDITSEPLVNLSKSSFVLLYARLWRRKQVFFSYKFTQRYYICNITQLYHKRLFLILSLQFFFTDYISWLSNPGKEKLDTIKRYNFKHFQNLEWKENIFKKWEHLRQLFPTLWATCLQYSRPSHYPNE